MEMESDVIAIAPHYLQMLTDIDEELTSSDLALLKFLCLDDVPVGRLETLKRGIHLFNELFNLNRISSKNLTFLQEILYRSGRIDLLKKLQTTGNKVKKMLANDGSLLKHYRIILFEICEELISSEVDAMKFLLADHINKQKLKDIQNSFDLFVVMERQDLISPMDLTYLEILLVATKRHDLVVKLKKALPESLSPANQKSTTAAVHIIKASQKPAMPNPDISNNRANTVLANVVTTTWNNDITNNSITTQTILTPIANSTECGSCVAQPSDEKQFTRSLSVKSQQNTTRPRHVYRHHSNPNIDLKHCYPMTRSPRGLCVIINNEVFTVQHLTTRTGSAVDCRKLRETFQRLDFKVKVHNDLNYRQMSDCIMQYSLWTDHLEYDCFVCCILTHGIEHSVYSTDGEKLSINSILDYYKPVNCRSLQDKPKLFFIQACQGKYKSPDIESDAVSPVESDNDARYSVPNEADFLIGSSTVPGYVSYRSRTEGSWYVTCLTEMLNQYADREDLLHILTKVNNKMSEMVADLEGGRYKQCPMPSYTLRKSVFFKPISSLEMIT